MRRHETRKKKPCHSNLVDNTIIKTEVQNEGISVQNEGISVQNEGIISDQPDNLICNQCKKKLSSVKR